MTKETNSFSSERRRWLKLFGLGATGTAIAVVAGSDKLFARQFLDKGTEMRIPEMAYDRELQVMVDPITRKPIYDKNNELKLAKVTAGCSDCPKYDE